MEKSGVGYHKKGYPNQNNKKRKGQSKLTTITRARAPTTTRPTPQDLGHKIRLARPLRASHADTVSPDPLGLGRRQRLARSPRPRAQAPSRPIPSALGASSLSPDPLGLGRKFRLARPLQGSGAGRRSTRSVRLPPQGVRTRDVTGTVTPIPQQDRVATVSTTLGTATLPLSLCDLTSFTVVYRLTVKREWGRLISITICCLLPLLTG